MKKAQMVLLLWMVMFFCQSNPSFCQEQRMKVISIDHKGYSMFDTLEDVQAIYQPYLEQLGDTSVVFYDKLGEELWLSSYDDMGVQMAVVPIDRGFWRNLQQPYGIQFTIDETIACQQIDQLYDRYLDKPKDAYFKFGYDNLVTIVPEKKGELFDYQGMLDALLVQIQLQGPVVLSFMAFDVTPEVTEEFLRDLKISTLWGQYSTRFNGSDIKRTTNIWLASTAINEYILMPGEIFSFNTVVGPRTKERGYQEAGVIINNHKTKDIGGGVCQVSSTLYNAARAAELTIIEAHRHTITVHYVPKGRDAAVVYGDKDLKFKNTTNNPVVIKPYFAYGQIAFKIFGGDKQAD